MWGPTVRDAELNSTSIEAGATGVVTTLLGVRLPFEITAHTDGARWAWKVAGCPRQITRSRRSDRGDAGSASESRAGRALSGDLSDGAGATRVDRDLGPGRVVKVAVIGATGYVGGRLVPELLAAGHDVRCLARNPDRLAGVDWRGDVDVVAADVLDQRSLEEALVGIEAVYYLVHAMGQTGDFEHADRLGARTPRTQPNTPASPASSTSVDWEKTTPTSSRPTSPAAMRWGKYWHRAASR